MSKELTVIESRGAVTIALELTEKARDYFDAAQAAGTRRAYASDLRHFGGWCRARGLPSLPAEPQT